MSFLSSLVVAGILCACSTSPSPPPTFLVPDSVTAPLGNYALINNHVVLK